jgi:hypothetical protein
VVPPFLPHELGLDLGLGELVQGLHLQLVWAGKDFRRLDGAEDRAAVDALDLRMSKSLGDELDVLPPFFGEG